MKRSALILTAMAVALAAAAFSASAAIDPTTKCQLLKLKTWSKYATCQNKQRKLALLGKPTDEQTCRTALLNVTRDPELTCRFIDNADGTVTDLNNGLMWQKTDDAGGLTDKDADYTWSASGTNAGGTVFTTFLSGLNTCSDELGLDGYGGHCDWRLPNYMELYTSRYVTGVDPEIDQTTFGPVNSGSAKYWTMTTYVGDSASAWYAFFAPVLIRTDVQAKTATAHARAVRYAFAEIDL